jgi:phosphocarrier protein
MPDDVVRRQLMVSSPSGLHARPAARIAEVALRFTCQIELRKGTRLVNAKSIMDLLTLAAEQGQVLELETRGADAAAAAVAIEALFIKGTGDIESESDIQKTQ